MTRRQRWRLAIAWVVLIAVILGFFGTWPNQPTNWHLLVLDVFFGFGLGWLAMKWALEEWRR